jgi:tetratricopeptide (TPR) repeat protein
MMEEILNQLTKIKDLEVISRTSSMIYRDSKLPLKQIAAELGVSKIVEGSVQKAGDSVRITVQLIDGVTQKHLWSETFDKELSNLFSIQTEISMNIARELKAILTSKEEDLIRQIPTKNLLAYDYYLKAIQYDSDVKFDLVINMLNKAIEQDPEFALAYLARAQYYSNIFFTKDEYHNIKNWKDFDHLARADLEKAMKINPDLPEVKFIQARLFYNLDRNNDRALELLDELIIQTPNNSGYTELKSWVLRRKGLWEEHLEEMQKGLLLDPLNGNNFIEDGLTYRLLRRYPEAMDFFNKPQVLGVQLGPDTEIRYAKFLTILLWKGNVEEALKISELRNTELGYNYYPMNNYFYYSRKFDKLIQVADKTETQFNYFPKSLSLAQACFLSGNNSSCKNYADSAISELKTKVSEFPDDDRFYAALGYAYAYKEEKEKAIENAQKAVRLKPLKLDAWQGYVKEVDLTNIYILTGEYDLAMDKIEFLLTIPGDLSIPLLKVDPAYDRLRNLPRFQKILATEYKTNY